MPVIFSQINDDWHQHWECLFLISLQDIEEVVVLKEAHGSISNLQVDTSNAFYNSLEKFWNQVLDFIHFADFKNLLQLGKEKSFFDTVGEWPEFEETF